MLFGKNYNGYVWRATNGWVYLYDSADGDEISYDVKVMNARRWMEMSGGLGIGAKGNDRAGSIQGQIVELSDVFTSEKVPGTNMSFADLAKSILYEDDRSASTKDESRAGAMITSMDYTNFQDVVVVGENAESPIRTGILPGLFESIQLDNLSGKWATQTADIKWFNNLPESSTPEPSKGSGSTITVNVPKGGAAVGWTDRSKQVINGGNPFASLVGLLNDARLANENEVTAEEIELNTTHTQAGVDFGARTGTPPASTTNPLPTIQAIKQIFASLKVPWNLFISKSFIYNEYITNDILNPTSVIPPTISEQNGEVGPFPFASGVTWAREDAMDSSTDGFALNSIAIKVFRAALIQYTVRNEDHETTKVVMKNHFNAKTVDDTLIYLITGIAA